MAYKKKHKKHKHKIEGMECCPHCGTEDGICVDCGREYFREPGDKRWKQV